MRTSSGSIPLKQEGPIQHGPNKPIIMSIYARWTDGTKGCSITAPQHIIVHSYSLKLPQPWIFMHAGLSMLLKHTADSGVPLGATARSLQY